MIDSCQVRGGTEVCRCVVSVRRRHGCAAAQWRTRQHGGALGNTMITWWSNGAAPGGTVSECVWQVARWDGVPGGKV